METPSKRDAGTVPASLPASFAPIGVVLDMKADFKMRRESRRADFPGRRPPEHPRLPFSRTRAAEWHFRCAVVGCHLIPPSPHPTCAVWCGRVACLCSCDTGSRQIHLDSEIACLVLDLAPRSTPRQVILRSCVESEPRGLKPRKLMSWVW